MTFDPLEELRAAEIEAWDRQQREKADRTEALLQQHPELRGIVHVRADVEYHGYYHNGVFVDFDWWDCGDLPAKMLTAFSIAVVETTGQPHWRVYGGYGEPEEADIDWPKYLSEIADLEILRS